AWLAVVVGVIRAGAPLRPASSERTPAHLAAYEPAQGEVGMVARPGPGDNDTPRENRLHLLERTLADQRLEVADLEALPCNACLDYWVKYAGRGDHRDIMGGPTQKRRFLPPFRDAWPRISATSESDCDAPAEMT